MVKLCLKTINLPVLEGAQAVVYSNHLIFFHEATEVQGGVACSRSQSLLLTKAATWIQTSFFLAHGPGFFLHATVAIEMLVLGLVRDWH